MGSLGFRWVMNGFSWGLMGYEWVLLGFDGSCWVLLGSLGLDPFK